MKNTKMVKLILGIIALGVLLTSATCSFRPQPVMKIKAGRMTIVDCLQFLVAEEKGFFKQENLEIETVIMAGGADIAPAVESGELDIGFSNVPSIIFAYDKGIKFKFLTPGSFRDSSIGTDSQHLLMYKGYDSLDPEDFNGKTVAINTMANINELAIRAWFDKNKVDIDKVNVVPVPFPQMESAFETQQIDVAIVNEPFATLSLLHGVTKVLDRYPLNAISRRLMVASWFVTESRLKEHPREIQAFIRAINKATKFIVDNPEETAEIVAYNTRLPKELSGKIRLPLFTEHILKEDLQVMIDASFKYGFIKNKFDAQEIVIEELKLK
ncbi:MAG: ABC transporter substrate-binding protein [Candidatus Omnitrophica bacterium]|nr:ABC transporter substrate-binding protein [Candidatus Omnitrophota bacterium]